MCKACRFSFFPAMFAVLALAASTGMSGEDVTLSRTELDGMKRAQQEMLIQMRAQQDRIEQLEQQVRAQKSAGIPMPPSSVAAAIDTHSAATREDKDAMRWSQFTVNGKSTIKLYGVVRLDAIYDDSAPNNTHVPAFIRSEDPTAPAAARARRNNDDFTMHPRLTRIGADFLGPKIGQLGNADVSGKLEIDFYNNGLLGQSESRQALRMRHGYVKLKWDDVSLLAGQTADLISPLFPIVNPDLVMWGAGNLGDRRPQVRAEWTPSIGKGKLSLAGAIGLTGANDNADLDPAGTTGAGFRDGETSGKPTLQARLAYKRPLWEKQPFEFGLWAHRAWEEPDAEFPLDTATVDFNGENEFDSYAFGFDLSVPLYKDVLWVKAEGWTGKNVDDVRGGIFQGINVGNGREIFSRGGFVELGARHPKLPWYSLHAGYATDDPDNSMLSAAGRAGNKTWYIANRFNFDPIELGIDYLRWRTDYKGFRDGTDNRFQAYISYKF